MIQVFLKSSIFFVQYMCIQCTKYRFNFSNIIYIIETCNHSLTLFHHEHMFAVSLNFTLRSILSLTAYVISSCFRLLKIVESQIHTSLETGKMLPFSGIFAMIVWNRVVYLWLRIRRS